MSNILSADILASVISRLLSMSRTTGELKTVVMDMKETSSPMVSSEFSTKNAPASRVVRYTARLTVSETEPTTDASTPPPYSADAVLKYCVSIFLTASFSELKYFTSLTAESCSMLVCSNLAFSSMIRRLTFLLSLSETMYSRTNSGMKLRTISVSFQ